MEDRGSKLLELIRHGLAQRTARTSAQTLGDRSKYIGMSDIGAYLTCPRKAILNRLHPEQKDADLSKLLTLNRGHWFEDGIASILKELKIPHIRQLEIGIEHEDGFQVKAHLDFVLVSPHPKPTVRILEVKSCRELPEVLYPSYEMQVYGQVGLLARHWDGSDFSLTDENGEFQFGGLTFPEAAHQLWGIDLPDDVTFVDIEAWVLCLSMTDAKVFGPYVPDEDMLEMALDLGADLWGKTNHIKDGSLNISAIHPISGFKPICEHCEWNRDCPKFGNANHPELEPELEELARWKKELNDLQLKVKIRENAMKDWYERSGLYNEWITAGNRRFKAMEISGRRKLDKDGLAAELTSIFQLEGLEGIDVHALIEKHEQVGEPSTRLYFSKVDRGV